MNKIASTLMLTGLSCSIALNGYMLLNKKNKNMLDILIEEIETIK